MAGSGNDDLVALFDASPMRPRYWGTLALLASASALDFFDFYIVGFLVAVLGPQWHLTYGQSAIMLLSAGVGAIVGALAWGSLADAAGRKRLIVAGTIICGCSALGVAFIPDGDWLLFAVLRFGVGFGLAGASAPSSTLIVEYTPTRHRTMLSSLMVVFSTAGSLIASGTAATLLNLLGWRGIAALGFAPAIVGLLLAAISPESVRWLVAKGRFEEARATVARLLDLPIERVPLPTAPPTAPPRGSLADLYSQPWRFWFTVVSWAAAATANYGVYLWGPTIVALSLNISVKDAAHYFVYVAATGMVGKVGFALLAQRIGRRRSGQLHGIGLALTLATAGFFYTATIGGFPVFIILLAAGALFFDGGFSNLSPYTIEIFTVRLAARGAGLGQAANGVGKILGPLCLALIAGADNILSPKATENAVVPAFLFLAGCGIAIFAAFSAVRVETHGRPLAMEDNEAPAKRIAV